MIFARHLLGKGGDDPRQCRVEVGRMPFLEPCHRHGFAFQMALRLVIIT